MEIGKILDDPDAGKYAGESAELLHSLLSEGKEKSVVDWLVQAGDLLEFEFAPKVEPLLGKEQPGSGLLQPSEFVGFHSQSRKCRPCYKGRHC